MRILYSLSAMFKRKSSASLVEAHAASDGHGREGLHAGAQVGWPTECAAPPGGGRTEGSAVAPGMSPVDPHDARLTRP
jgi:hypothetical protein